MRVGTRALIVVSGVLLVGEVAVAEVVSLQPIRDNTLCEDASGALSNGAGHHLFAGRTGSGDVRRGLLLFDVAGSIPPGSVVTSVRLRLHVSRTVTGPQTVPLWNVPIPEVQPPVSFALPIPGVPRVGTIGFVQTLTTAGGIVCTDAKLVDTGAP